VTGKGESITQEGPGGMLPREIKINSLKWSNREREKYECGVALDELTEMQTVTVG